MSKDTTDTSPAAVEAAWEEFDVSSKPIGESDGIEMFNVEGMGDDAWNIMVIARALVTERDALRDKYTYIGKDGKSVLAKDLEDERDALRLSLAEARNAALDEAAAPFLEEAEHDESGLLYSSLVGIPISNAAELQKSADRAQSNADRILALKTPLQETQNNG